MDKQLSFVSVSIKLTNDRTLLIQSRLDQEQSHPQSDSTWSGLQETRRSIKPNVSERRRTGPNIRPDEEGLEDWLSDLIHFGPRTRLLGLLWIVRDGADACQSQTPSDVSFVWTCYLTFVKKTFITDIICTFVSIATSITELWSHLLHADDDKWTWEPWTVNLGQTQKCGRPQWAWSGYLSRFRWVRFSDKETMRKWIQTETMWKFTDSVCVNERPWTLYFQ